MKKNEFNDGIKQISVTVALYIRGKRYKRKWTADYKQQEASLRKQSRIFLMKRFHEDHNEPVDVIVNTKVFADEQNFSLLEGRGYEKLMNAVKFCQKNDALLFYMDISKWRRNIVLNDFIKMHERGRKKAIKQNGEKHGTVKYTKGDFSKNYIEFIKVSPTEHIIDTIERQAREEKINSLPYLTKNTDEISLKGLSKEEKKQKKTELLLKKASYEKDLLGTWRIENNVSLRRFNNFKHLVKGVSSIHKKITENENLTPKALSDLLHNNHYTTPENKRWSDDNVRKTRKVIESHLFQEFLDLYTMKKEENFAEDI